LPNGPSDGAALIGDIGATNARFALVRDGKAEAIEILSVGDYPSLEAAIEAYLAMQAPSALEKPRRGALAVAGPVTGDFLAFTNHPWSFSIAGLKKNLGFDRLDVINDFLAVALAVPRLTQSDYRQVGPGSAVEGMPIGIIGPGTGLGVSTVVPIPGGGKTRWQSIAGEGGHATLPTVTPREAAVVEWVRRSGIGHVSAERLLSGAGIAELYSALCALDGLPGRAMPPADVTAHAAAGTDPDAVEAIAVFCALLGTVAGNLALTLGARGGIYIAGGIVPKLGALFDRSDFRARFVDKGRMKVFLDPIPTFVITNDLPAFVGLTALVDDKPSSQPQRRKDTEKG
jgi:glucokinase